MRTAGAGTANLVFLGLLLALVVGGLWQVEMEHRAEASADRRGAVERATILRQQGVIMAQHTEMLRELKRLRRVK